LDNNQRCPTTVSAKSPRETSAESPWTRGNGLPRVHGLREVGYVVCIQKQVPRVPWTRRTHPILALTSGDGSKGTSVLAVISFMESIFVHTFIIFYTSSVVIFDIVVPLKEEYKVCFKKTGILYFMSFCRFMIFLVNSYFIFHIANFFCKDL
jgi:hypothetical protein